jgi:hypothetical protein
LFYTVQKLFEHSVFHCRYKLKDMGMNTGERREGRKCTKGTKERKEEMGEVMKIRKNSFPVEFQRSSSVSRKIVDSYSEGCR